MINKDALNDLNEVIIKMDRVFHIYRSNVKLAKELNVPMPLVLRNKMAALEAMCNICEKVHYYYSNKIDLLFADWVTEDEKPGIDEIRLAINLVNQYRDLKFDGCADDYFIPHELCRK